MDKSEEYAKMCRAAKEIINSWEWNEGDFYAGIVHTCKNEDFNKVEWPMECGCVCTESHNPNYRVNCGDYWYSEIWPMPRIDQLQEMCVPNVFKNWGQFYFRFISVFDINTQKLLGCNSAEQALLICVMIWLYKKDGWDGEKWIV
jgi:hypothetical protein